MVFKQGDLPLLESSCGSYIIDSFRTEGGEVVLCDGENEAETSFFFVFEWKSLMKKITVKKIGVFFHYT